MQENKQRPKRRRRVAAAAAALSLSALSLSGVVASPGNAGVTWAMRVSSSAK